MYKYIRRYLGFDFYNQGESMEQFSQINSVIGILITVCFLYQWLYVLLNFIKKPKKFPDADPRKYAILISARNEEKVIAQLIDSINKQDYPKELIDVYVIADNCTDQTAEIAKNAGATVFKRQNSELIGKGFALNELIHQIWDTVGQGVYDGFMIFDADNLLDSAFVTEINKAFCAGHRIITSYRNSKNFSENWVAGCSGTWLLRESAQINCARMMLGISSVISGTGFCVAESILIEDNGFISKTLSEDTELSYRWICRKEKIAYCDDAIFYDEQPTKFSVSFKQRLRWVKGSLQNYLLYGFKLIKGCFKKGSALSCLDALITIIPAAIVMVVAVILNIVTAINLLSIGQFDFMIILPMLVEGIVVGYGTSFLISFLVMITERKRIKCSWIKRIWYSLIFPIYFLSFAIIAVLACFSKVKWTPIEHNSAIAIDDIK